MMAVLGENGFGVKLHTFYGQGFMLDAHDFIHAAIVILSPSGDIQTFWQVFSFYHQRMVARCSECFGNISEYAKAAMVDGGGFPMHDS